MTAGRLDGCASTEGVRYLSSAFALLLLGTPRRPRWEDSDE